MTLLHMALAHLESGMVLAYSALVATGFIACMYAWFEPSRGAFVLFVIVLLQGVAIVYFHKSRRRLRSLITNLSKAG